MNAICVENLSFDLSIILALQFNPILKERVLNDILEPKFTEDIPQGYIKRSMFRVRCWRNNEWKRNMCHHENSGSPFWNTVKNHLLKPL